MLASRQITWLFVGFLCLAMPLSARGAEDDLAWPEETEAPVERPAAHRARPAPRSVKAAAKRNAEVAHPPAAIKPAAPKAVTITAPKKADAPVKAAAKPKDIKPTKTKAGDDDDDDDDDVETIEDVGTSKAGAGVDGNSVQIGAASEGAWTLNKLWGHMHAALVHMPIAWLLAWAGAECLALLWPHPWLLTAGLPIGLMTALSFAPSVYSGLMRLDELSAGESGYDVAPALLHRNLMLAAWTLVVLAIALRLLRAPMRFKWLRRLYLLFVFVGFLLLAYSAHLGGVMVYGEEFFPF